MADNIKVLNNTLNILEEGFYCVNSVRVNLITSSEERQKSIVLLPDEVCRISDNFESEVPTATNKCDYEVQNMDSFDMAERQYIQFGDTFDEDEELTLVLNFANPMNPGGGVRRGARAQEEDLCRRSSLLQSLETEESMKYYVYNASLKTYMGSDAMILSPRVEVFRNNRYELINKPYTVAVLTCAAPMITFGLEGKTQPEYEAMVYMRIERMIQTAVHFKYKHLVLGAWGCGAFRNDAGLISDLFHKVFCYLKIRSEQDKDYFNKVDFAVLDKTANQYNYKEFERNFGVV